MKPLFYFVDVHLGTGVVLHRKFAAKNFAAFSAFCESELRRERATMLAVSVGESENEIQPWVMLSCDSDRKGRRTWSGSTQDRERLGLPKGLLSEYPEQEVIFGDELSRNLWEGTGLFEEELAARLASEREGSKVFEVAKPDRTLTESFNRAIDNERESRRIALKLLEDARR